MNRCAVGMSSLGVVGTAVGCRVLVEAFEGSTRGFGLIRG